jgi:hypothetical protein
MRNRAFLLLAALAALAPPHSGAKPSQRRPASPYRCTLDSTLSPQGRRKESFTLTDSARRSVPPRTEVALDLFKDGPRIGVQQFLDAGKRDSIHFQLQCDEALNCKGSRIRQLRGRQTEEPFSFTPSTEAAAYLGGRKVFGFRTVHRGFRFEFIASELDDGQRVGLTVECRDG